MFKPCLPGHSVRFLRGSPVHIAQVAAIVAEELKAAESALKCLNGTAEIREIDTEWGARSLVLIEKHGIMPKKYPRRPGVAAKNPL